MKEMCILKRTLFIFVALLSIGLFVVSPYAESTIYKKTEVNLPNATEILNETSVDLKRNGVDLEAISKSKEQTYKQIITLDITNDKEALLLAYEEPLLLFSVTTIVNNITAKNVKNVSVSSSDYYYYAGRTLYMTMTSYAYQEIVSSDLASYELNQGQFSWHAGSGAMPLDAVTYMKYSFLQSNYNDTYPFWSLSGNTGWPEHHLSGSFSRNVYPTGSALVYNNSLGYAAFTAEVKAYFQGYGTLDKDIAAGWGGLLY